MGKPERTPAMAHSAAPPAESADAPTQADTRAAAIAARLVGADRPEDFGPVFVALLRELAHGRAVSKAALGAILGWPHERAAAALEHSPGTEYDDNGDIVGLGLTLRETRHSFEVDGHRLYTWCALDALMFPALIGKVARVTSNCPQTGAPVSMTVAPQAISGLTPASAVVSLVMPDASADIRSSFCCQVHFFASTAAAQVWAESRTGAEIVTVDEAFCVGREIVERIMTSASARLLDDVVHPTRPSTE